MAELNVALARELRIISESLGRLAAALGDTDPDSPTPSKSGKRILSPAHRRALKQHGKYLNLMSQLTPQAKARVKARRRRQGVAAAIALAQRLSK